MLDLGQAGLRAADRQAARRSRRDPARIHNPVEKFAKLRASGDPQAQFLWAIYRDLFHYSAVPPRRHRRHRARRRLRASAGATAGSSARSRPGRRPAGAQIARLDRPRHRGTGKAMSTRRCRPGRQARRTAVHTPDGSSTQPAQDKAPAALDASGLRAPASSRRRPARREVRRTGTTRVARTTACACGRSATATSRIVSFKTKMNTVNGLGVLDGRQAAPIDEAEQRLAGAGDLAGRARRSRPARTSRRMVGFCSRRARSTRLRGLR